MDDINMENNMAYAIAVDFDGVLHRYSKGWHDGTIYDSPVEGAFNALRKLMQDYAVFIHTTRDPLQVGEWLQLQGDFDWIADKNLDIMFWNLQDRLLITNKKYPAIAYIDDRAIRFLNWNQALKELEYHVQK